MVRAKDLPSYANLPPVKDHPHGYAWGLFDQDGKRDQNGTLNLLSPEVVLEANKEVKTGVSISLDLPVDYISKPGLGRISTSHKIISFKPKFIAHDDEVTLNTQGSSQWDGLKHFGNQETQMYYNGLHHDDVLNTTDNGIHHWLERGGIVGRGVLLDFVRFAEKNGIKYEANNDYEITVQTLKDIARDQGTEIKPGDILIVRTGFVKWYAQATDEQRETTVTNFGPVIGVEPTDGMLEWLWDSHFSAVASDAVGFESMRLGAKEPKIHVTAIAGWGLPVGELWDLEQLSRQCEKEGRWSFFLTSAPLRVVGGVASPPNALAIF